MGNEYGTHESENTGLLAPDEPAPFTVVNPRAQPPLLLVCDHASRRLPRALGDLGLDPAALRCHLAWDIGAGELTERLAVDLGVTAVLAGYSRLVVDCNRELLDPQAFLEFGDGVVVPGNRGLCRQARDARADAVFWPYHDAIAAELGRLGAGGELRPAVIAIHSFTPVLNGVARPWEIGILWDADARIADILLAELAVQGYKVGNNEPYSGRAPQDFTIDHHAEAASLPHVGIEIRQDLIDDAPGVRRLAEALRPILMSLPERLRKPRQPAASG